MMQAVIDHLWQSSLFLGAAAAAVHMLRANAARLRYGVWFAASVKFLIPFSLLAALGEHLAPRAFPAPPPAIIVAMDVMAAPEVAPPASFGWIVFVLWAAGSLAVAALWLRRYLDGAVLLRSARPAAIDAPLPVKYIGREVEPSLVGIWRPVLLLPSDLVALLRADELNAVIAHEVSHYRRRDNLTAAIHMAVQTLFWFHPLVWWIGARLVAERERACDEAVIEAGSDADTYAEAILKVCRFYVSAPVLCAAGVSGGDLVARLERIVGGLESQRLGFVKRSALSVCLLAAVGAPFALGWARAPLAAVSAASRLSLLSPQERAAAALFSFEDVMTAVQQKDVIEVMIIGGMLTGIYSNGGVFRAAVPEDPTLSARLQASGVRVILPPRANPAAPNVGPASIYPAESKAAGEEGSAVLQILVDQTGDVVEAVIERSTGHSRLDTAATLAAMDQWHFMPGTINDVAAAMNMRIRINFKLDSLADGLAK